MRTRFRPPAARRWMPRVRSVAHLFIALGVLPMLIGFGALRAQDKPSEYDVKAAYLFTFGKFVKWPAPTNAPSGEPFTICILGQDPFGAALDSIASQGRIAGLPVQTRRFSKPDQAARCRVVFISSSEEKHLGDILTSFGKAQILTVSDIAGFSQRGGMIEFVLSGDRVRFNVNLAAARSAGLGFSSELLKVALTVRQDSAHGE